MSEPTGKFLVIGGVRFAQVHGEQCTDCAFKRATGDCSLDWREAAAQGLDCAGDNAHYEWAETSWNRGFRQGLDANRLLAMQAADALKKEREAHAETNRAMTDALLMMEEREKRDEALLRQALEALEFSDWYTRAKAKSTIAALRERLGEGEQQ